LINNTLESTRKPANLSVHGKDTVKIMAKKNFQPVHFVNEQALHFARDVIDSLLPQKKYDPLSVEVATIGNGILEGLDFQTSSGYPFGVTPKKELIDQETGKMKPVLEQAYDKMVDELKSGKIKQSVVFTELLKDELRNDDKVDKPRCFKASPLHYTILLRQMFLELMKDVQNEKLTTGVMIGINPLGKEWDEFAKFIINYGGQLFDGDQKGFDGSMNSMFQQQLHDVLSSRSNHPLAGVALNILKTILTLCFDEVYIATHGMPSGCALTAFYNSCISIMYIAYAWFIYKEGKTSLVDYFRNVKVFAYGDDVLILSKDRNFNGQTVHKILNNIGLEFTTADKKEWDSNNSFKPLADVTFLKRRFVFHSILNRFVAPLEPRSTTSTLSWVSDKNRLSELSAVKCLNFQREAWLHDYCEKGVYMKTHFLNAIKEMGKPLHVPWLSDKYLIKLYNDEDLLARVLEPQQNKFLTTNDVKGMCICDKCVCNSKYNKCQMIHDIVRAMYIGFSVKINDPELEKMCKSKLAYLKANKH